MTERAKISELISTIDSSMEHLACLMRDVPDDEREMVCSRMNAAINDFWVMLGDATDGTLKIIGDLKQDTVWICKPCCNKMYHDGREVYTVQNMTAQPCFMGCGNTGDWRIDRPVLKVDYSAVSETIEVNRESTDIVKRLIKKGQVNTWEGIINWD